MRCPHCAGQIPDRSIFCGICGRQIGAGARGAGLASAVEAPSSLSPSLFELPVSRNARMIKLFAVLALDLVLLGAGIAMILSYLSAREQAMQDPDLPASIDGDATSVVIGPPIVAPLAPAALDLPPSPTKSAPKLHAHTRPVRSSTPARDSKSRGSRSKPTADSGTSSAPGGSGPAQPATPAKPTARAGGDSESAALGNTATVDAGTEPAAGDDSERDARMEVMTRRVAIVVNKHRAQFQRCYRQVAKASGAVQGKVVIRFKIKSDGQAIEVRAASNQTQSERLAACLVAQFSSWSFPSHSEPAPIDFMWPIVFKTPS